MSTRGLSLGIEGAPFAAGTDEARGSEQREEAERQLFGLVAGLLAPLPLQRVNAPTEIPEPTPVAWRPSDVALTDLAEALRQGDARAAGADGTRGPAAVVSRIETAVQTAALGRVQFVVDRSNAGMSILVEVTSEAAAAAVEKDRRILLSTLRGAGITVLSFRVLLRASDGPTLAGERTVPHAAGTRHSHRYPGSVDSEDDDETGRVEVVG